MQVFVILSLHLAITYGSIIRNPVTDFNNRIIGGELADINDFPHQLAMLLKSFPTCGASIITPVWALTAAHCTKEAEVQDINLIAGSSFWQQGGTEHQVVKNIWNPCFNVSTFGDFDVALLKVSTKFAIGTPGIAAIALADISPSGGEMAVVSGWGRTESRVSQLKKVSLPVISHEECIDYFKKNPDNGLVYKITDNMMCAGWPLGEGVGNTCSGDSGGPLVVDGRQVGIVSWGLNCDSAGSAKVFADVANLQPWIRAVIENN